jgi:hypothetical protein
MKNETETNPFDSLQETSNVDTSSSNPFDNLTPVKPTVHMSTAEAGVSAFNAGVERFTNSILLGGAKLLDKSGLSDTAVKRVEEKEQRRIADKKAAYESHPTAAMVGDIAAGVGTGLMMPGGTIKSGSSVLSGVGQLAATAGKQSAVLGALAMPEDGQSRAVQAATWGAGGLAGGAVVGSLIPAVKGIGTYASNISKAVKEGAESGGIGTAFKEGLSEATGINTIKRKLGSLVAEDAGQLVKISNENGMPIAMENILKGNAVKVFTSRVMDKVPFSNTRVLHEAQAEKFEPIIKKFIRSMTGSVDDEALNETLDPAQFVTKFNAAKKVARIEVDKAYNDVERMARTTGSKVGMNSTLNAIDEEIAALNTALEPGKHTEVINTLLAAKQKIGEGNPTFSDARVIRQAFSDMADSASAPGGDAVKKRVSGHLKEIIAQDLDSWGNNAANGDLYTAYQKAQGLYKPYATVFKNPQIASAMKDDAVMNNYVNSLINDRNPAHLRKALKYTDDVTNSMLKAKQVQSALEQSMIKENGENLINVRQFNKILTDGRKETPMLWGPELDKINGLTRFLDAMNSNVSRSGVASAGGNVLPTALTASGIAGTALVSPTLATGLTAGAIALKPFSHLLTSKALRDSMIRWSKMTPNASPQAIEGLKQATLRQIQKARIPALTTPMAIGATINANEASE